MGLSDKIKQFIKINSEVIAKVYYLVISAEVTVIYFLLRNDGEIESDLLIDAVLNDGISYKYLPLEYEPLLKSQIGDFIAV